MRDLLYIVAVILIIGWLVGFVAFSTGPLIHTLLIIALGTIMFNALFSLKKV